MVRLDSELGPTEFCLRFYCVEERFRGGYGSILIVIPRGVAVISRRDLHKVEGKIGFP